ncbi:MAG TPA: hypothetical protein VGI39_15335 [Polyangiaceae bacterium]
MAIEFQIKGDFPLDEPLARALSGVLDPGAEEFPPATESVVFTLADAEISVTAVETPGDEHESMLFFRVLAKGRVLEAEEKILRALDAVLRVTEGPLLFFFSSERLLLERVSGEVRLQGADRGAPDDFWTEAHRRLISGPVVFAARKGGPKRGR